MALLSFSAVPMWKTQMQGMYQALCRNVPVTELRQIGMFLATSVVMNWRIS